MIIIIILINKVVIQYLTHQILTNKNSPTDVKHQLRKMETLHNQTLQNQATQYKHYHMKNQNQDGKFDWKRR